MIEWEKSAKLNNTSISELKIYFKKYSKSHKNIIAICDNPDCKKERKIEFKQYRDLCQICAIRAPENREHLRLKSLEYYENNPDALIKISEKSKEYWSHPEHRDMMSEKSSEYYSYQENRDNMSRIKLQFYKDHPELIETMSDRGKQYQIDHPESAIEHSIFMKEYYSDSINYDIMVKRNSELWTEDRCEAASIRMKKYLKNHPDVVENWKELMTEYWSHQENRDAMSELKIQYYEDHPEVREKASAREQGIPYKDWNGFIDNRSHVTRISQCLQLNDRFPGSHGHHIIKSIIIFIPKELHLHIRHNLKTGENMNEINILALQYIKGEL